MNKIGRGGGDRNGIPSLLSLIGRRRYRPHTIPIVRNVRKGQSGYELVGTHPSSERKCRSTAREGFARELVVVGWHRHRRADSHRRLPSAVACTQPRKTSSVALRGPMSGRHQSARKCPHLYPLRTRSGQDDLRKEQKPHPRGRRAWKVTL